MSKYLRLVFCLVLLAKFSSQMQSMARAASEGLMPVLEEHENAAVRDLQRSIGKVQPLLKRYGYGAAAAATLARFMHRSREHIDRVWF
jgi:hypothetical protein